MDPVYYEDMNGNAYVITQQKDGTYLRALIDQNGKVLDSYQYKDKNEMEWDSKRMFEIVPESENDALLQPGEKTQNINNLDEGYESVGNASIDLQGSIIPETITYDPPVPNIPGNEAYFQGTSNRQAPKFIQQAAQFFLPDQYGPIKTKNRKTLNNRFNSNKPVGPNFINNMFSKNPHSQIYADDLAELSTARGELKDMRQQNRAEIRESNAQRKLDYTNAALNRQADRNVFLKAKQDEMGKTRKYKRLAKEIKNMGKLEKKIARLANRHEKSRNNINSFHIGGDIKDTDEWKSFTLESIPGLKEYKSPKDKEIQAYNDLPYPKPYGVSRDKYGNSLIDSSNANINKDTIKDFEYDPTTLHSYGNRLAENALNRTTAYNIANSFAPAYQNKLFIPDFKYKRQIAQADYTPVIEQENVARQQIAQNQRSTAGLMGNLQQLAANMTRAKSKIARAAQQQQRQYDKVFQKEEQDYANKIAQEKARRELLNKQDEQARSQFRHDTMTEWEKADRQRARLYNSELKRNNQLKTYLNQLSSEYKAVMDDYGRINIVFKNSGKVDPVKTKEAQQQQQVGASNNRFGGYTAGKYKYDGETKNKIKKRRNTLFQ